MSRRDEILERLAADPKPWVESLGIHITKRSSRGWIGFCPFHDDTRNPSFSLFQTEDGAWLWKCFAGCGSGNLIDLYMRLKDLTFRDAVIELADSLGIQKAPKPGKRGGAPAPPPGLEPTYVYDYTDAAGNLLYQALRYEWEEHGRRTKSFRQRRPARDDDPPEKVKGDWCWNLEGVGRVPYRLPEVDEALDLFLVEGEKKVELLRSWGLTATCFAGGSSAWRQEYATYFRGKRVLILPDNDEPGEKLAQRAGRDLLGEASRVLIARLPGLPPGGDVVDYAAAGHGREDFFRDVATNREEVRPEKRQETAGDRERKPSPADAPLSSAPPPPDPLLPVVRILTSTGDLGGRIKAARRALSEAEEERPATPTRLVVRWEDLEDKPPSIAFIERGPACDLPSLDRILNGLRPAWYVIEGDPGLGKSTFVAQLVSSSSLAGLTRTEKTESGDRIAHREEFPWLVVPMEEDPEAWRVMWAARLAKIDGRLLATRPLERLPAEARDRFVEEWPRVKRICESTWWPSPELHAIHTSRIPEMVEQWQAAVGGEEGAGRGGVVIDPVHALIGQEGEKEYDRLERARGLVMELCRRWRIPVITTVHLNREGRAKGTSSFEFSGQIRIRLEQGELAKPYNEGLSYEERQISPYLDCRILKNKNLATGAFLMRYERRFSRFTEIRGEGT